MKSYDFIKSVLLISFGALLLVACGGDCNKESGSCCAKNKEKNQAKQQTIVSDESIYMLDSDWKNKDGNIIKLESLKGFTVVAAMVFTHCESACPRIVSDMQRIEKEVGKLEKIKFLLISMDPERDTPQRFEEFLKERQLSNDWVAVSSDQEATDEIANVLGVKIKKLSQGGFDHSNSIYVLNNEGEIVHVQEGLEQDPAETIEKIKSLNVVE